MRVFQMDIRVYGLNFEIAGGKKCIILNYI